MVNKFKLIVQNYIEDKKNIALLALLKMDDLTDRWSIVFSASNIEGFEERKKTFEYLIKVIKANLDIEEQKTIARVGVFPLSNHLVQGLLKYKSGYEITEDTKVNGNIIHYGIIIESNVNSDVL